MSILEAKNVAKQYRVGQVQVKALDGASLSVEKGDFIAVMGPSGSGKSTLLHVIGGLDRPSQGEVILQDRSLSTLSDRAVTLLRRRSIGFVFQTYNLLPTLTAEENVALPLVIDGKHPRDYQAKVDQVLQVVGLAERKRHKPDQLSGGEQQRVAIARALVTEPTILLADEPTGNLDSIAGEGILQLLRQTCDEHQQTMVVVTHDPRVASYADRVLFLKDGRIVESICPEQAGDVAVILRRLAGNTLQKTLGSTTVDVDNSE
jgi:putative ABC transport system ATP-binding protein